MERNFLGSTEIIGPLVRFDQREVAFTRLALGKLGKEAKKNWLAESPDPFWRLFYGYTRKENSLVWHLRQAVDGPVKPEKLEIASIEGTTTKVKAAGKFFGADLVGVTKLNLK